MKKCADKINYRHVCNFTHLCIIKNHLGNSLLIFRAYMLLEGFEDNLIKDRFISAHGVHRRFSCLAVMAGPLVL